MNPSKRLGKSMRILIFFTLLVLPTFLFGAVNTDNQQATILQTFIDASSSWSNAILPTAKKLFYGFVIIDFVITFGFLAIKGTEFGEIFGELIRKILWIGFFLFLFNSANLLSVIPESFSQLASTASGMNIMPDTLLELAMTMVSDIWGQMSITSPADSMLYLFVGIICLIAFGLMSAQLFMTLVRIQVLIAFSYLVFAFGGLSYTRTTAINPLRAVFSAGMELMIIKLILALTLTTVKTMQQQVEAGGGDIDAMIAILAISVILASLVMMVNGIVNELMNGLMSGNSTSGLAVASGAMAGAVVATSQMAKQATGTSSAIKEARALSANGQGGAVGNYARALGKDMLDSVQGKNARSTVSAGTRMAESMKSKNTSSGTGGGSGEVSKGGGN